MSQKNHFDVESYRNPFESNTEWRMRKEFLLAHHDKLDIDRLICLSNCYVNVEVYGCRYPDRVHTQLNELTKDITVTNIKTMSSRIKGVEKIAFVKSSDSDPPKMEQTTFTQGSDLQSVAENMPDTHQYLHQHDPYAEFQMAMNDSGISLSSDYQNQYAEQYHYQQGFQKYGEDDDCSKQVEEYLKQWAAYYESLQGQNPQIRYDYRTFQNQSDAEEQVSQADDSQSQNEPQVKSETGVKRKIGMVNPSFNFVKASSEFKSTEISEIREEQKKNLMIPAVLAGKNRLGLGAESKKVSQNNFMPKGGKPNKAHLETQFSNLCREVKSRYNPNKNAIEVLHQSADKCKMPVNNVYHTNERMPDGRVKYTCILEISGVFISDGGAPSKKVAKMEAYNKAMALLTTPPVMLKEKPDGQFYLDKKVEIGPSVPEVVNIQGQANKQAGKQMTQNTTAQPADTKKVQESYAKPKMVFHKASEPDKALKPAPSTAHPLSDKPLEFKKQDPASDLASEATAPADPKTNGNPTLDSKSNNKFSPGQKRSDQRDRFQKQNFQGPGRLDRQNYQGDDRFNRQNYQGADRFHRQNYQGADNFQRQSFGQFDSYQRGNYHSDWNTGFQRKSFLPAGHDGMKRGGDRFDNPAAVKKVKRSETVLGDLSEFIIMDYSKLTPNMNAITILHNSANFNRVVLKYQFEEIDGFGWRCKLILSDEVVASSFGSTKEDAKKTAGEEALNSLRKTCFCISVKQDVDNDEGEGFTKDELVSEIKKGGNVIPDNNIGNMLLRKMGWSGGGVGKHGTGIVEPVKADQVIGREGLGLTASRGIDKTFHEKVQEILVKYTRSNDQNDMHFSPEFTKEERAVIHKAAQKFGLKTHSKGKDEERFLIVSRKRSAPQLLDHVMSRGGTTSKYEVIPPLSQQTDEEYFARDRQPVWDAVSYGHDKQ